MNVPQLRFDGFNGEWKKAHLGDISIKIQDGNYGSKYPTNEEFLELGIPFLTGKVLGKTGRIDEKKVDYISMEKHKELSKAHIQADDILFTNRGASVGAIGFNDGLIQDGNIGPQLTLIRADTEKILSKLLFQIIKAPTVQRQILENDSGSAMKFFGIESTKKFKIAFPVEKEEQKKIVSFLNLLDRTVEKQIEKVEKLEEFKKGMMQKIFSQELRFQDEHGREFGEWEEQALTDFTKRVVRKNKGIQSTRPLTISAQQGLVDQREFFNKNVASANTEGYYLLKKGEFAYNKSYSNGYPWGAIKRLDNYEDGVLSTLYICFEPLENVDSDFLSIYFESSFWYKEVSLIAGEGARNHGLLNIGVNDFFETKHKIPSIKEQKKIASIFMQLNRKIDKEKEKLMILEKQKKGFMQKMFI